jgi:mxaK protein
MNLPTMKRNHVHAAFAVATITLAAVAAQDAVQLQRNAHLADDIAAASQRQEIVTPAQVEQAPEAALAQSAALASGGDYDKAAQSYKRLTLSQRPEIRHVALLNLGNLHLRESLREDVRPEKERALVELAKQSYRDLLDTWPDDWSARYNLDRALWIAPERDDNETSAAPPPVAQRPTADRPPLP